MIILHPDHLISATTIGDSFGCMRKAVLQDRIKATSDANEAAMVGTILHEIFQEALKANRWDHEWLVDLIQRSIPRMYETILEIGVTVNHIIERLVGKIPQIQAWAKLFVKAQPGVSHPTTVSLRHLTMCSPTLSSRTGMARQL